MLLRFLKYKVLKMKRHRSMYVATKPPYSHCKNCGYELHGQYCSVCGQFAMSSNRPFRESIVFYLEHHYALDHKLGTSLRYLFFKPGFLAREYMEGRIERHVHPFRLYLFASILLFGIVLSLPRGEDQSERNAPLVDTTKVSINNNIELDSTLKKHSNVTTLGNRQSTKADSATLAKEKIAHPINSNNKETSAFEKKFINRITSVTRHEFTDRLFHYMSLSTLLLMPIFALLLKLLYFRREKYYTGHLILSVHLHVVLFLAISIGSVWSILVDEKYSITGWLILGWLIYLIFSLSRFYREPKKKSTLKAILLLFIYAIVSSLTVGFISFLAIMI